MSNLGHVNGVKIARECSSPLVLPCLVLSFASLSVSCRVESSRVEFRLEVDLMEEDR